MVVDSFYNFKEQSTRNQDQAQKWGNLMLKVHERLDKVEKDINDAQDAQDDFSKLFSPQNNKNKKVENSETPIPDFSTKETPGMISLEELN